jgi:hypothetical protein
MQRRLSDPELPCPRAFRVGRRLVAFPADLVALSTLLRHFFSLATGLFATVGTSVAAAAPQRMKRRLSQLTAHAGAVRTRFSVASAENRADVVARDSLPGTRGDFERKIRGWRLSEEEKT